MEQNIPIKESKTTLIRVRISASEKTRLFEEASFAGITVSELFRSRAANKRVFAATDLAMLRELRRIGGLLKHVHTSRGGAYSEATRAALMDVRKAIQGIGGDHQAH